MSPVGKSEEQLSSAEMPSRKHGFKKKTSEAESSIPQKDYKDYVYDIGDRLTGSDLEDRIERFEATYKATRQEYQGFSFRNDNDEEVAIPPEVARSIHAHCEFRAVLLQSL